MVIMFRTGWITRPSEKAANALSIVGMRSSQRRRGRICSSVRTSISCLVSHSHALPCLSDLGLFPPGGEGQGSYYQVLERQTHPPHDTAPERGERCFSKKNKGLNGVWQRSSQPT